MENENFEFQVGDIVSAWGILGEVREVNSLDKCGVYVTLNIGIKVIVSRFYMDGKECYWHKEPTLKFISRPKKKIKKTYWFVTARVDSYLSETFKRNSSHMYLKKEQTDELFTTSDCHDRQIHSIEIEEEV